MISDDQLYDNITFRETLIIGKLGKGTDPPTPVGGLCLDIQSAKGLEPLERKFIEPSYVDRLNIPSEDDFWAERNSLALEKIGSGESEETVKYLEEAAERVKRKNTKFLVHLSSQFDCDGKNAGSRMTSWVDRNFHTLEEKRKEYVLI